MRIEELRKEALLWGLIQGNTELVDRLLDLDMKLPEVAGDFSINLNGIPACLLDYLLVGYSRNSVCEFGSLHRTLDDRKRLKAAFPGAVVAIVAGSCPAACRALKAA